MAAMAMHISLPVLCVLASPASFQGYGGQPGYAGQQGYAGGYQQGAAGYGQGAMVSGQPANVPEDVWAAQGYPVPGPNGWTMYRTKDTGEPYYHNSRTNETIWDRPADWPVGA